MYSSYEQAIISYLNLDTFKLQILITEDGTNCHIKSFNEIFYIGHYRLVAKNANVAILTKGYHTYFAPEFPLARHY